MSEGQQNGSDLSAMLEELAQNYADGVLFQTCRTVYEANLGYLEATGSQDSRPEWPDVTPEILAALRATVMVFLEDPSMTCERFHEKWLANRVQHGWVHGPERDAERKIEPCLVPYADLPEYQRVRYHLIRNVVRSFR